MMEMFNKIAETGLCPNEFYLLYCMRESISTLNINQHAAIRILQEGEWIDQDLNLQPKAMSLVARVESFFKIHKKKTSTQLLGKEFLDNLTKYNELFPRKKAGSGKYMRSNIKNVETSFRWFFENYEYDWPIILQATTRYVEQQDQDNFKYSRTSMYFIRKQQGGMNNSDLADYCAMIVSGEDTDDAPTYSEKVV